MRTTVEVNEIVFLKKSLNNRKLLCKTINVDVDTLTW